MARNLRQKYKDLKKRFDHMNRYMPLRKSIVETKDVRLQKVGVNKMIDMGIMDNMPDAVLTDIAFDLAKFLVKEGVIDISEKRDPYSGRVNINASLLVGINKDA